MYCLYQTTNLVNGRYYIGVQQEVTNSSYLGSGRGIRAAIKKYKRQHFRKDILAECATAAFAYQLEAAVVDRNFVARTDNYNLCVGGKGGVGHMGAGGRPQGWKHTPEARQRI